jgi:hypothetical protein
MFQRNFPGPWRAEPNEGGNFVIKDANGFAVAYVYARSDPALQDRFLTPAEASVIAHAIAKLTKKSTRRLPASRNRTLVEQKDLVTPGVPSALCLPCKELQIRTIY